MQDKMMDKEQSMPGKMQGEMPGTAGQKGLPPEQQKAFKMVSKQALEYLLAEGHAELIIAKAKQGDPKQAVVDALTPVMQGIWSAAEQAGANLDQAVFLAAGIHVITILSEMLAVVGIIQEQEIPQFAQEVAMQAVQQHNAAFEGQQQPEQPEQAPQGLAGMAGGV
jgi:hypothetical protein